MTAICYAEARVRFPILGLHLRVLKEEVVCRAKEIV